ncbi:hypothetical protein C9J85_14995 [Haloferax sp. wsp5]|nr:hypothetical protein C9J85_14995 [Haloferax sp. wsp5]
MSSIVTGRTTRRERPLRPFRTPLFTQGVGTSAFVREASRLTAFAFIPMGEPHLTPSKEVACET